MRKQNEKRNIRRKRRSKRRRRGSKRSLRMPTARLLLCAKLHAP
jgi:hypothetical protein